MSKLVMPSLLIEQKGNEVVKNNFVLYRNTLTLAPISMRLILPESGI